MKLSCLPVSWYEEILTGKMSLRDWLSFAAGLRLDAVDLTILFLQNKSREDLQSLRQLILDSGLELCMVTCYPDLTHPDRGARAQQIEGGKTHIRMASQLGAKLVRVTAGQSHPSVTREEGIGWAVEGLRQLAAEADQQEVLLVYENHTKGAPWQYWDFSQASDIFLEILGKLDDTSLGINFDTANPLVGNEDPIALLGEVKDRVVSVHAADIRAAGSLEPVVLGTGVVPFHRLFSNLKETGFDGWICIEEASRTGARGFEEAVSFVRKAWEEA